MIQTHRRRNLCEAYLVVDRPWVTLYQLKKAGAYGSSQSIHRAMRKLMINEEAVIIVRIRGEDGKVSTHYKITETGMVKLGRFPAKRGHNAQHQSPEEPR